MNRTIDHLVYAVPNLEDAMESIGQQLGIHPVFGGHHETKGTKNALLNLGNGCYLEILSVDESNTSIDPPRWMGVDLIKSARMTRWALKSSTIQKDSETLRRYFPEMGSISKGTRKTSDGDTLSWQMILPLASPEVELIPFMVDWSQSSFHPTEKLEPGCMLTEISFHATLPNKQTKVFADLDISNSIIAHDKEQIVVTIEGPKGTLILE